MQLDQPFVPSNHDAPMEFEPIKAGWYAVVVAAIEKKPTKKGDGHYLKVVLKVDENAHPSIGARLIFTNLNLWNKNQDAVEISRRALAALCNAAGIEQLTDTDQLIGKRVAAKVTVKPAKGDYPAGNEVKNYDKVGDRVRSETAAAADTARGSEKPPWG